jgi:dTDP-glucose 4,6-dehydratase
LSHLRTSDAPRRIAQRDLEHVLAEAEQDLVALRGSSILVTGATGFVGSWLVETAAFANAAKGLNTRLFALVPPDLNVDHNAAHIAALGGVRLVRGDIRTLERAAFSNEFSSLDAVIHAAISVDSATIDTNPIPTLDTAVEGTRRVLRLAEECGAQRFLFLSSGAVYGPAPAKPELIPESHLGGPDPADPRSVYAEGKRIGETMCACVTRASGMATVMARGFAFVGPHLPLDRHFAVGNFIRDALAGGPIVVSGDGTPVRSYQYAADMAIWLWALMARGEAGRAYNVGSSREITIADLARLVAGSASLDCRVEIRRSPVPGADVQRYVPDVRLATSTLGVRETVSLEDAIERTIRWHQGKP